MIVKEVVEVDKEGRQIGDTITIELRLSTMSWKWLGKPECYREDPKGWLVPKRMLLKQ